MLVLTLLCGLALPVLSNANENKLELLRQTSDVFSSVEAKTVPAVVFIKEERTIETGYMTSPGMPFGFFGDEFSDRFFGDDGRPKHKSTTSQARA